MTAERNKQNVQSTNLQCPAVTARGSAVNGSHWRRGSEDGVHQGRMEAESTPLRTHAQQCEHRSVRGSANMSMIMFYLASVLGQGLTVYLWLA